MASAALLVVAVTLFASRTSGPDPDRVRAVPVTEAVASRGPAGGPRTAADVAPFEPSPERRMAGWTAAAAERLERLGARVERTVPAPGDGFVAVADRRLLFLGPAYEVRASCELGARSLSRPAVSADGTAYVGTQDERLLAVAPDGRPRWAYRARADLDAAPAIAPDGAVFAAGDDGRVLALEPDGRVRFVVDVGAPVRGALAVSRKGLVLVGTMGPRPRVVALDARTGARRALHRLAFTDGPDEGISGGLAEDASGNLYVAGDEERILVLSPGLRPVRELTTHCPVADPPVVVAGTVAYRCEGSNAVRFAH